MKIGLYAALKWLSDRLKERSTWDGTVILTFSAAVFFGAPFLDISLAIFAVYGIWTIVVSESHPIEKD